MVFFLLLIAVVAGHQFALHGVIKSNRRCLHLKVCARSGIPLQSQIGSDSVVVLSAPVIDETTRVESIREDVLNFLADEAVYLDGTNWELVKISSTKESICFKCTSSESGRKSLFLKHSQQPRSDVHNRLRYEFEGTNHSMK